MRDPVDPDVIQMNRQYLDHVLPLVIHPMIQMIQMIRDILGIGEKGVDGSVTGAKVRELNIRNLLDHTGSLDHWITNGGAL